MFPQRSFIVPATLLLLVSPLKADDQSICNAVLSSAAFNTYNASYQSHISLTVVQQICTLRISSDQELQSQSSALQAGGQYYAVSGFLNAAQASTGSSIHDIYDRMCNKHDFSFINDVISSQRTQLTNENVAAWERCVVNRTGLFSALKASLDNKTFIISLHYKKPDIAPPKLILKGISPASGFDCKVGGSEKAIADFSPEDEGLLGTFGITCSRTSPNTNNIIAIETSVAEVGPMDIPGQPFQELTQKVDQLQQQITKLSSPPTRRPSPPCQREKVPPFAINCNAPCLDGETVVSGFCIIPKVPENKDKAAGAILNIGLSPENNSWHCLWAGGDAPIGEADAFCKPK